MTNIFTYTLSHRVEPVSFDFSDNIRSLSVKGLSGGVLIKETDVTTGAVRTAVVSPGNTVTFQQCYPNGIIIDASQGHCEVITTGNMMGLNFVLGQAGATGISAATGTTGDWAGLDGVDRVPSWEENVENENENQEVINSILKSVFCSYRGVLVVHDVHGNRVGELCGEMTMDKYREIERRSRTDITEFDGLENYRSIAEKKEKEEREREKRIINGEQVEIGDENWETTYDPLGLPIKAKPFPNGTNTPAPTLPTFSNADGADFSPPDGADFSPADFSPPN